MEGEVSDVVDRARGLNAALPLPRLQRILHLLRCWIGACGPGGGLAVSPHELAASLELPSDRDVSVEFLTRVLAVEPAPGLLRVDTTTLLTTTAVLAQGSLEDKAALVFSLVDVDMEDDIAEHELALAIATCSDGLTRLGILKRSEQVDERDAVAIALEAFAFVGVDTGDKMNLAAFKQWLAFHPRPQTLFDRLSCIFSICDVAKQIQRGLKRLKHLEDEDPAQYYDWVHLKASSDHFESIHIVTGPIIGKVTESTVHILLEVDADVVLKCFAFPVDTATPKRSPVRVQECTLKALDPQVFILSGLSPGTTYSFRLLGVCRSDREKRVASVTTFPLLCSSEDASTDASKGVERRLTLKFVNHLDRTEATRRSSDRSVDLLEGPSVTVHYGIQLPRSRLAAVVQHLQGHRGNQESLEESSGDMLKECVRGVLVDSAATSLLRSSANYFLDSSADILGDFLPPSVLDTPHYRLLQALVDCTWKKYLGALWGHSDQATRAFDLAGIAVLVHCKSITASTTVDAAGEAATQIASIVKHLPLVSNIVIVATTPLTPDPTLSTQTAVNEAVSSPCTAQWTLLQSLVDLSKTELSPRLLLAAFSPSSGYQTSISAKNTKVSINQLVCGPSYSVYNVRKASLQDQNRAKMTSGAVALQHTRLECRPHVGQVAFPYQVQRSTRARLTTSGPGRMILTCQPSSLQPELTFGPVVGFVSHSTAKIMIETADAAQVDCVLTGRLIHDSKVARQRTRAYKPAIFTFQDLRPGTLYDVSFPGMAGVVDGSVVQTPFLHSPALRLAILSDDNALDGSICDWNSVSNARSYLHDISSNIFPPAIDLQADLVLHLGCIASVTQTISSILELWRTCQGSRSQRFTELEYAVRDSIRRHWSLRATRDVLSRGSHWFSSVGVARALLARNDIPRELLLDVCRVFADYERVGSGSTADSVPAEQLAVRLQQGVVLLPLDTMQSVILGDESDHFGQFPDTLVAASQWEALEYWLGGDLSTGIDAQVNTFVIVSDIGLVGSSQPVLPDTSSWSEHPTDLIRLLGLIFRRLHSSPTSCVLFLASGSASTRSIVRELATGRTFQHVQVGPVSQPTAQVSTTASATKPICIGDRYMIELLPTQAHSETPSRCHYSTVDVVPHPLGSEVFIRHYNDTQASASIVVGPVIGRVTTRTARILIELDRDVDKLLCTLVDSTSSHRVTTEAAVKAFDPTVLKVEGLRPGTRYRIEFEGLMKTSEDETDPIYVATPPLNPLTTEWLVTSHNIPSNFISKSSSPSKSSTDCSSSWNDLLTQGMRSYNTQVSSATNYRNGDTLGGHNDVSHAQFNPWHYIQDEIISDPLTSPQVVLHLGGQVDMRRAFADDELVALVQRIAPLQSLSGGLTDKQEDSELEMLRRYVRYRMQEVYRVYWSIPTMKTALHQASHFMFLDLSTDVFFTSAASLRDLLVKNKALGALELEEAALQSAVKVLQDVAFELWQLYQNQLWFDVLERDLDFGSRSSLNKLSNSITSGLTRLVMTNVNPEVQAYCSKMEASKRSTDSSNPSIVAASGTTADAVSLFSPATWKVLEEAVTMDSKMTKLAVNHLVIVLPADLVEWGGTTTYPELRPQIVRLLETVATWKLRESERREVAIVSRSVSGSSMSYVVSDEKTGEKLRLLTVGSISQPRELIKTVTRGTAGSTASKTTTSAIKGHFSKRFTYRSTTNVTGRQPTTTVSKELAVGSTSSPQQADQPVVYRSFASFQSLTDLRSGFLDDNIHFFPPRVSPKVTVGPVLGRMTMYYAQSVVSAGSDEETGPEGVLPEQTTCLIALPVLLEVNASARITCVVTDVLAYQETRVTEQLAANEPHIFVIPSLLPERRYLYRFEGVSNGDIRRGCFHTPPPSTSLSPTSFICTSSNFPDHLDGSTDSLWTPIRERVALPWTGIDFVVHVGGQVPLQEAVVECIDWVKRELHRSYRRKTDSARTQEKDSRLRRQVRKRMQQHYRRVWSLPSVREVLSSCSNWFLRSQADVAPFFGIVEPSEPAARIVLDEAKRVVEDYQLKLMREVAVDDGDQAGCTKAAAVSIASSMEKTAVESEPRPSQDDLELKSGPPEHQPSPLALPEDSEDLEDCTSQLIQHGATAFFVCDMRSARPDDVVTCGGRLSKPLTQQERPIIGERQWQLLETALKAKKTQAFVLLLELPLVLTSAEHVDKQREEQLEPHNSQGWSLYDVLSLPQHWVSCRRQLELLLHVLFRWKLKRRGRDVLVVSGGLRVGIDSLVRDAQSGLSLRTVSVGPITARVGPFTLPTSGTACPEFLTKDSAPGTSKKPSDSRFSFTHSLVTRRNYVLAQVAVQQDTPAQPEDRDDANSSRSALINAAFVSAVDADGVENAEGVAIAPSAHPVDLYRRVPSWWTRYIPMGSIVFWDDSVSLRAASDDDLQALQRFIDSDRAVASALEVCYDKYEFAEAGRLEELRSAHSRQRMDLSTSLRRVLTELWRLVPEHQRRLMAYVLDPYVLELLLGHLRASDVALASVLDGDGVEFHAFAKLCRSVLWSSCLLRLSLGLYEEDAAKERSKKRVETAASRQLARLEPSVTPETTKETRKLEKLEKKRAGRLREAEEELAIAREQQRLNKLADSRAAGDAEEFARASAVLETRVRVLDEAKKQRKAERGMRSKRKQRRLAVGGGDDGKPKGTKE